jgi:hypothetical protein
MKMKKKLSMNQQEPPRAWHDLIAAESGGISHGPNTDECSAECVSKLIRQRAYELFESRGRQPGHEVDDWLQAEYQIKHHLQ